MAASDGCLEVAYHLLIVVGAFIFVFGGVVVCVVLVFAHPPYNFPKQCELHFCIVLNALKGWQILS